jgi:uncharacterized SAM-binding protein YcdF (DUF218 family)
MFYVAAKLLWFVFQPSSLMVLSIAAAAGLFAASRRRAGNAFLALALLLGLVCWSPLPRVLAMPLEERFPRPELEGRPVTGILVLGGSELADIYFGRNHAHAFSDAGERISETVALARRLPQARVVVVGGSEYAMKGGFENNVMAAMLTSMGVPQERMTLEFRSRDTWENAAFARDVVHPQPGDRWLLVTSAWHMPRAMGVFRKNGFPVEAWPVDYRTASSDDYTGPFYAPSEGLALLDLIVKEYFGLLTYRLAGRIDTLFPGP